MDALQLDIDRGALQRLHSDDPLMSRESPESSDVELMDVEILDSEEEMNPDDPFRDFNSKRPASAPAGGKRERNTAVIKRPVTAPATKKHGKTKKRTMNLLEILLPDNYDLTASQNDFSALHCSTQATEQVDVSTADITVPKLVNVPEHASDDNTDYDEDSTKLQMSGIRTEEDIDRDEQDGDSDSNDSEPELLGMEIIDPESTVPEDDLSGMLNEPSEEEPGVHVIKGPQLVGVRVQEPADTALPSRDDPGSQADEGASSVGSEAQVSHPASPVNENVPAAKAQDPPSKTTSGMAHDFLTPVTRESPSPRVSHAHNPKSKTVQNPTVGRPAKRKSTLEELCSKTTRVPYRTGLSKRANINHLHPNLKKK